MAPLRIAILECDTPIPEIEQQFGRYGDIFANLLLTAGATMTPPMTAADFYFTKHDVEKAEVYPDIDDVDHILITGSRANAFDLTPWITKLTDFTQKVLLEQDRVRVIGVCFGHQIVGRALGGVVDRNEKGWEISITKVTLNDVGKHVFGRDSFNIHQMHRDHLVTLPISPFASLPDATLEIIGETDTCAVQGLYTPGKVLTVQGHPEFNGAIIRALCATRRSQGIFTKQMEEEAVSRADLRNDGPLPGGVAVGFLKFLLD